MSDDAVVFLGPSLPVAQAQRILPATYLPPVAMGDVLRVLARKPAAIAIIDGWFDHTPSVRHKEILIALSRGVCVYGAASMGALRAVDTAPWGTVGVGQIFDLYRDGELSDDDEVAVVHGPAEFGYRAGSDAMVNIRLGLGAAARAGVITLDAQHALVDLAKARFYPDRSWGQLYADAAEAGMATDELAGLRSWVTYNAPDAKRDDAVALLRLMAEHRAAGWPARPAPFAVEPSRALLTLLQDVAGEALADVDIDVGGRREALRLLLLAQAAAQLPNVESWIDAFEPLLRGEASAQAAMEDAVLAHDREWVDLFVPAVSSRAEGSSTGI
jgi:hypothetical protein